MSPQTLLRDAVADGLFPGASAYLARGDAVRFHGASGILGHAAPFEAPATTDTVYDLASLTKIYVLGAALRCLRANGVAIDTPLAVFLPGFLRQIALADLMNHASGLELHLQTLAPRPVAEWLPAIVAAPLTCAPATRVTYLCTNYFLLGRALVEIEGAPLERIVQKYLLEPGQLRASFAPVGENIAPTERDEAGLWLCGRVHDEAARAFRVQTGDCAGNAGLFADAADVAAFARLWFDDFFHPADLSAINAAPLPENSCARGLGFQIDAPFYMSEAAPRDSWGHLGFTGPSLVLHRATRSVAVVLNNRVHPTRNGPNRLPAHRALAQWNFED